ncbi:MAG: DEAD/DEAH box helicase [Planctomycetota bacterium]|nr:DEAD/DEAH box helicase [Planctomycetota bacterium]
MFFPVLKNGNNTIVATRTSSGKSLIFSLPALDVVCRDADSTALFLYLQKALANDQYAKLVSAV